MAADVLAIHLLGGAEVVVGVGEAHETVALTLGRLLVSDDTGLGEGRVLGECFEEGLVGDFACQVAYEEARVLGVPLKQALVLPGLAPSFANDRLALAVSRGLSLGIPSCCSFRLDTDARVATLLRVARVVCAVPLSDLGLLLGVIGASGAVVHRRGSNWV
jgi:hypothetical protein